MIGSEVPVVLLWVVIVAIIVVLLGGAAAAMVWDPNSRRYSRASDNHTAMSASNMQAPQHNWPRQP
ncbi:hypothetical protein [Nocardia amamiensis]|uniref:hypothetical protein n=1 Tax=Nocardia amamiensis TaxID=404578 RepID=UPI0012F51E1B|nr:hypothetical protein [Nocardia amamiensis]